MASNHIEISVVMSVYNGEKYLIESIDSILGQSFKNFEFIIINDGSTDGTQNIVESYDDDRIHLICQENQGLAKSLNNGVKQSNSNIIARMDGDDICYPNRFQEQIKYLNNNKNCITIGSNANVIDQDGNYVYATNINTDPLKIKSSLPFNTPFIHPSIMFYKDVFFKAGMYPDIPIAQDLFFIDKMSAIGEFANIEKPLIKYRISPSASIFRSKKTIKELKTTIKYFAECGKIEDYHIERIKQSLSNTNNNEKHYQYHLLLAKKYLWNNFQPNLARENIKIALKYKPLYLFILWMYILSFLSGRTIRRLYLYFK